MDTDGAFTKNVQTIVCAKNPNQRQGTLQNQTQNIIQEISGKKKYRLAFVIDWRLLSPLDWDVKSFIPDSKSVWYKFVNHI